jgi:SAM-dependent methyltransferase
VSDRRFYEAPVDAVKRSAPAALRNVGPIGDVLAEWLPASGLVLELASGTGQHGLAFARRFGQIEWQPSDASDEALASIAAWREAGPDNLLAPIRIDAAANDWPIERADAMIAINLLHISPWETALGLLDGAARLLAPGGPLILYGPWIEEGLATVPSNQVFDMDLRARDSRWGLREVSLFASEAKGRGLDLAERRVMPANNIMLRFERR